MILCTRLVSGMTFIRYAHNIKILKTQIFIKSVGAGKVKGLKQDGQTHCLREIDRSYYLETVNLKQIYIIHHGSSNTLTAGRRITFW